LNGWGGGPYIRWYGTPKAKGEDQAPEWVGTPGLWENKGGPGKIGKPKKPTEPPETSKVKKVEKSSKERGWELEKRGGNEPQS